MLTKPVYKELTIHKGNNKITEHRALFQRERQNSLINKQTKSVNNTFLSYIFSSPDPKGHVSYCHHLASVVRRKLFQKSSPLKVLDQWKPNLV